MATHHRDRPGPVCTRAAAEGDVARPGVAPPWPSGGAQKSGRGASQPRSEGQEGTWGLGGERPARPLHGQPRAYFWSARRLLMAA
jgi:hypothetical protein